MPFLCHKIISGRKYAYEITSKWDPESRKVKKTSKYLGLVQPDGSALRKKECDLKQESAILDFGDGFLLAEFVKKTKIYSTLSNGLFKEIPELLPLLSYKIANPSALYNAQSWIEGNVTGLLHKKCDLSSQNTSRVLAKLGEEKLQQDFFAAYLQSINSSTSDAGQDGVIIDATSLPTQIHSGFNAWGRSSAGIEQQFRLLCVISRSSHVPLFYRFLPGNIVDVTTLHNTVTELKHMGVNSSFVLLDAGYCSQSNIQGLYASKIDFLVRLPADRKMHKNIMNSYFSQVEKAENAVKHDKKTVFVKQIETSLYGHVGYAYILLDLERKSAAINKISLEADNELSVNELQEKFDNAGIMMLISSRSINPKEALATYYTRQAIEQIFSFFKSDLDSLPIRRHNDNTVRGYLFLQFITLILFIELRQKLQGEITVEQAMLTMRNLKCKRFESELLISELTRKQKRIFAQIGIMVPKTLGI